jgi:tRNA U34 2-thiouridine synthase MnmA/TrmU
MASLSPEGLLRLRFDDAQRAVSAGQLVALIDAKSDEMLGAGTITSS